MITLSGIPTRAFSIQMIDTLGPAYVLREIKVEHHPVPDRCTVFSLISSGSYDAEEADRLKRYQHSKHVFDKIQRVCAKYLIHGLSSSNARDNNRQIYCVLCASRFWRYSPYALLLLQLRKIHVISLIPMTCASFFQQEL